MAERAAKLHLAKTKTVSETVRGAGKLFQFRAPFGVQQIELFVAVSKPTEADSQEPDFSFPVSMRSKEFLKHGKNVGIEPRGLRQCFGARVRLEPGVANRQRKRPRRKSGFAQALACFLREVTEHGGQRISIVRILAESVIVGDGFRLGVDHKFVGIAAARFPIERRSPLAENAFQFFLRHGRDLLDRFDAEGAERAFRDFTDARNFSYRQCRKESLFAPRGNPDQATRFGLVGGDFGDQARCGKSTGAGKRGRLRDRTEQLVGCGQRRAVQSLGSGEIEVGLVDRNHFDDRRKFRKNGGDAVAPFPIFFVMAVEKNRVWAESSRGAQRHRGMDAILSRFVARGGNNAALIGTPADYNRLAAKFWQIHQFHRDEKRVHVHMEDRRCRLRRPLVERPMLGPKSREVRHALSLRSDFHRYNVLARLCALLQQSVRPEGQSYRDNYIRSAARTRGIPARSLVMATFVQFDESRSGWKEGRLLWPSSRTRIPPGLRCEADCVMRPA